MPVMNISTALSVFNMQFDQTIRKYVDIWRYDQNVSRIFIVPPSLDGAYMITQCERGLLTSSICPVYSVVGNHCDHFLLADRLCSSKK